MGRTFERATVKISQLIGRKLVIGFLVFLLFLNGLPAAYASPEEKVVHVVVALCDNINQGIVPVPAALGNGADPEGNLYWGAAFGVKTFMRKQPGWKLEESLKPAEPEILERIVLRNESRKITLVADAYQGASIKSATMAFLSYCSGREQVSLDRTGGSINAGGSAQLIVYMGHNGLMDFSLDEYPAKASQAGKDAAVFACQSKHFFRDLLEKCGARPLVLTQGNMAPEAYCLNALVSAWDQGKELKSIRRSVAEAYSTFQKSSLKGSLWLFDVAGAENGLK